MQNGDIDLRVSVFIIMLDGAGFVYQPVHTWWLRLLRKIAGVMRSKSLMLHTVRIDSVALRIVMSLADNPSVHLKILSFDTQEAFILREIIFSRYGLDHLVTDVDSEEEFKDLTMYADFMVSNHYTTVNGRARKLLFNNTEQVRAFISSEVSFKTNR